MTSPNDGSTARTRVHAFTDDALGEHDAVGLAEEIRAGRVSALEAVEAAIARVEKLDPELNGMACGGLRLRLRHRKQFLARIVWQLRCLVVACRRYGLELRQFGRR